MHDGRNAAGYTQLLVDDGKSVAIRSIGEQLKNPDGEDIYPGELNECTFDGKPFEKDLAQSFLKFLPPTRDPYIYWMNVEE